MRKTLSKIIVVSAVAFAAIPVLAAPAQKTYVVADRMVASFTWTNQAETAAKIEQIANKDLASDSNSIAIAVVHTQDVGSTSVVLSAVSYPFATITPVGSSVYNPTNLIVPAGGVLTLTQGTSGATNDVMIIRTTLP
jgi:hypothetical protein